VLGDAVGEVGAGRLDQVQAVFEGVLKEDGAAHGPERREGGREGGREGRESKSEMLCDRNFV